MAPNNLGICGKIFAHCKLNYEELFSILGAYYDVHCPSVLEIAIPNSLFTYFLIRFFTAIFVHFLLKI